jgi:hypothetical protein
MFNMISVPGAASHPSASNHSHPSGHSPATGDNAPPAIRTLIPAQNSMLDEWEFLEKSVRLRRAQEPGREKPNTEIINDSSKDGNGEGRICSASAKSSTSLDVQENSDGGAQKTQQVFFKALRENNFSELAAVITSSTWLNCSLNPIFSMSIKFSRMATRR